MSEKPFEERECDHCKGLICVRMPVPSSGCDHLYYPESCDVCKNKKPWKCSGSCQSKIDAFEKEIESLKSELDSQRKIIRKLISQDHSSCLKECDSLRQSNQELIIETEEQARILGISGSKEARLLAQIEELKSELAARIQLSNTWAEAATEANKFNQELREALKLARRQFIDGHEISMEIDKAVCLQRDAFCDEASRLVEVVIKLEDSNQRMEKALRDILSLDYPDPVIRETQTILIIDEALAEKGEKE